MRKSHQQTHTHTHTRACQHSAFVFVILFLLVKIILGHFKFLCRYVLNERHSSTLIEKKINPQLVARKIPQKLIKHSKRHNQVHVHAVFYPPTHPNIRSDRLKTPGNAGSEAATQGVLHTNSKSTILYKQQE